VSIICEKMRFILFCCFALVFSAATLTPITDFSQVPDGDHYSRFIPPTTDPALFAGKKIAMLVADYAEDAEVYIEYSYFQRRGAIIEILTPSGGPLYIADFIKPNYVIYNTTAIAERVNEPYFLVYISGGAPSSYAMRSHAEAKALIYNQFTSGRWLAAICSGSETLIEVGLVRNGDVTGSPTSRRLLELAGGFYHLIPMVRRSNLIMGQGPTYSYQFLAAIETAVSSSLSPPLTPALNEEADVDPALFHSLTSLTQIPNGTAYNTTQPPISGQSKAYQYKKVALFVSHASSRHEAEYLSKYFTDRGASVDYIAPWWEIEKGVVLVDGIRPTVLITGATPSNIPHPPKFDIAVVVGGSAWAATVMSNDAGVLGLIWQLWSNGETIIGASGTGVEVLGAAGILKHHHVAGWWQSIANLELYGAIYHDTPTALDPENRRLVTARGPFDMFDFCDTLHIAVEASDLFAMPPLASVSIATMISSILSFIILCFVFAITAVLWVRRKPAGSYGDDLASAPLNPNIN